MEYSPTQDTFKRYQELISLCKRYIQEEEKLEKRPIDQKTYLHFQQFSPTKIETKKATLRLPPQSPAAPAKKSSEKKPQIPAQNKAFPEASPLKSEPPKVAAAPPLAPPTPPTPLQPHTQTLSPLLPRPFHASCLPLFSTIKEKLSKLAPALPLKETPLTDAAALAKANHWKESYPKFAIVSFFAPTSEEHLFLATVESAITKRLVPCMLFSSMLFSPTQELAKELYILSQVNHLQNIVVAVNNQNIAQANDFLALFSLQADKGKESLAASSLFKAKGHLFETAILELHVTSDLQASPEKKRLLWQLCTKLCAPVDLLSAAP